VTTPSPPGRNPSSAREIDDPLADTARRQDFPGEDEQRHRDQDERLDAADQIEQQRVELVGQPLEIDDAGCGRDQRVEQRHARHRDEKKGAEDLDGEHQSSAP
jgi:hypothetical protein